MDPRRCFGLGLVHLLDHDIMTEFTHFHVEDQDVFTEEHYPDLCSVRFLCSRCGDNWATVAFRNCRHWQFITSTCRTCDAKWGGSLFDLFHRAFFASIPRALLVREFELEVSRHD